MTNAAGNAGALAAKSPLASVTIETKTAPSQAVDPPIAADAACSAKTSVGIASAPSAMIIGR